ncbi:uncharacterized protein LOC144026064 isoform X1 [Festucalex cinctus]
MAVSEENLLSLGHLNGPNVNTFSIYRNLRGNIQKRSTQMPFAPQFDFSPQRHQIIQTIRLQQRWQELKDRERAARNHNQKLMQQFDRAQETLREMMAATAAMKTIRMEYELFLVESSPYRQTQFKEKTQDHYSKNFHFQHLIATPSQPQSWARQNPPCWAPNQADRRQSSVGSSPEDAETSGSSKRKSFNLSQELDFKPVRLPSERVENGESSTSTECRQVKSDKRRRKTNTTTERARSSSQKSSMTSSAAEAQKSEIEASSHEGSTSSRMRKNIRGLVAELPMMTTKNETQDRERQNSRSLSDSQSEHAASQSPLKQSESSSGGNTPSRSEESSGGSDTAVEGKDNKEGMGTEEADDKSDGKEESDEEKNEDDETSSNDEIENESGEDQGCHDISVKLNKENKEQDLVLLQDEEEDDESEHKSDEEERDSDDIIISPQQNKPRVHFILQECSDDDDGKEGSRTGTSDEDSSEVGDDHIETLLAPQAQTARKEEKDMKAAEEPKGTSGKVICNFQIFRETHTDQQSDSDEFDHFYD